MKKIFITGISGLLGSNVAYLLHKKYAIYGQYFEHPFLIRHISSVASDLSEDISVVSDLLKRERPEAVIHCAAFTNVDTCQKEPERAVKVNSKSTALLAEITDKIGAKFVFISTDAVYKDVPGVLYKEDSELQPLNEYARSKLIAEESVKKLCSDHLIIRTNIYGYNYLDKLSLGEWVLSNLKESKSIAMFKDVLFTPILVNNLIASIDCLLEQNISGVFNVASRDAVTKFEFGRKIAEKFGFDKKLVKQISIDDFGFIAKRQKNMAMDVSKIARHIPLPTVDQGIQSFFELGEASYADKLKKGAWS